MSTQIETAIRAEAAKLIQRHQRYATELHAELDRMQRRSTFRPQKYVRFPTYWDCNPGFNPYHVRSNATTIAFALAKALRTGKYRPRPAVLYEVPKLGGGVRTVSVFQVADNAISRIVFKRLLKKNATRLSSRCYAYRIDITLHDAILDIASSIHGRQRVFVAEFDFSKYFESIRHDHIERILQDRRFHITDRERAIIWSFLRAGQLPQAGYSVDVTQDIQIGIPQGTSISLLLANVAADPLDRKLENLGVEFARYADDTLLWSDSYQRLCEAVSALEEVGRLMGVELNLKKSEGISLLTVPGAPAEIKYKHFVSFIGYAISSSRISIKPTTITRIKRHVARLIYRNLLEEPKRGRIVPGRFAPNVDRDYVVLIYQLRRYLYGNLTESRLRRYLTSDIPRIHYRGLMSFYPLVDDEQLLRALDGWMLHTVVTSLRKRAALLVAAGFRELPGPHGLSSERLVNFQATSSDGQQLDLRLPSFARISKLMRRASALHGPNAIANPRSGQYYVV